MENINLIEIKEELEFYLKKFNNILRDKKIDEEVYKDKINEYEKKILAVNKILNTKKHFKKNMRDAIICYTLIGLIFLTMYTFSKLIFLFNSSTTIQDVIREIFIWGLVIATLMSSIIYRETDKMRKINKTSKNIPELEKELANLKNQIVLYKSRLNDTENYIKELEEKLKNIENGLDIILHLITNNIENELQENLEHYDLSAPKVSYVYDQEVKNALTRKLVKEKNG